SFQDAHKTTFGQPGTLIIGTGPWEIKSLDPTKGIELSANPHWWGGKVPILHVSIQFFSDEQSLALAFRAGEIDLAPEINDAQGFASTSGAKLVYAPRVWLESFWMPVQDPPWNDIHVRRAVAYALDRQSLIRSKAVPGTPETTFILPQQLQTIASKA